MWLQSPAFNDGEPIPKKYTEDGANVSPPLSWSDVPRGVAEFVITMDDPDFGTEDPAIHWLAYEIPAHVTALPENIPRRETPRELHGGLQGLNSFRPKNLGYRGPNPPHDGKEHHYRLRVLALDRPLELGPSVGHHALRDTIRQRAKVLGEGELIGTYKR